MKHSSVKVCWVFCLLAMLTMRFFELSFAIDSATGFYKPEYSAFSYISNAVMIIAALAMLFFTYTDIESFSELKSSKTVGAVSILLGVAIGISLINTLSLGLQSVAALKAITELAATAAFFTYGIFSLLSIKFPDGAKLLFVPVWLIELIHHFVKNNDVSAVPEKVYDIIMLALCLLFSLSFAKHSCGLLSQKKAKFMFWLGSVTALFCFVGTLPRYLVMLTGGAEALHANSASDPMYLVFGVFAAVYLLKVYKNTKA